MNNWLSSYEYRVPIGWEVFAFSGSLAILIAFLTVSYQSVRAAIVNPAEILKAEYFTPKSLAFNYLYIFLFLETNQQRLTPMKNY